MYFGGVAAASFTVNSDGSITAVTPAGTAGTVDVTVSAAGGTSATSPADQFTYESSSTLGEGRPLRNEPSGSTTHRGASFAPRRSLSVAAPAVIAGSPPASGCGYDSRRG